jgi:hypothetical protein
VPHIEAKEKVVVRATLLSTFLISLIFVLVPTGYAVALTAVIMAFGILVCKWVGRLILDTLYSEFKSID